MRRAASRTFSPSCSEMLEPRQLLTTLIALIDSGVNSNSTLAPYLDMSLAINEVNGTDDVDDVLGHGTDVATEIVTEIQSAESFLSTTTSVEIVPIDVYDPSSGGFSNSAIVSGVEYAISIGANVINLSMEGPTLPSNGSGETLTTAIQDAESSNSVVVVAAGNNGDTIGGVQYGNQDIDTETPYPVYPAVLGHDVPLPNMLVVTSADSSGDLYSQVNYGQDHVDVAAPMPSDLSDTSYAAGYASAVVGVLFSEQPSFSYSQAVAQITQTVTPEAGLAGMTVSGGEIDAGWALDETTADLALNEPAYSSSNESSSYTPNYAVDGDSLTRWSSGQWTQPNSNGWIYVDLGSELDIDEVRLNWQAAYAVDYEIQVSTDGTDWTTEVTVTDNSSSGWLDYFIGFDYGQYVRIYSTETNSTNNYSLFDFDVWGFSWEVFPGEAHSIQQIGSALETGPAPVAAANTARAVSAISAAPVSTEAATQQPEEIGWIVTDRPAQDQESVSPNAEKTTLAQGIGWLNADQATRFSFGRARAALFQLFSSVA